MWKYSGTYQWYISPSYIYIKVCIKSLWHKPSNFWRLRETARDDLVWRLRIIIHTLRSTDRILISDVLKLNDLLLNGGNMVLHGLIGITFNFRHSKQLLVVLKSFKMMVNYRFYVSKFSLLYIYIYIYFFFWHRLLYLTNTCGNQSWI